MRTAAGSVTPARDGRKAIHPDGGTVDPPFRRDVLAACPCRRTPAAATVLLHTRRHRREAAPMGTPTDEARVVLAALLATATLLTMQFSTAVASAASLF